MSFDDIRAQAGASRTAAMKRAAGGKVEKVDPISEAKKDGGDRNYEQPMRKKGGEVEGRKRGGRLDRAHGGKAPKKHPSVNIMIASPQAPVEKQPVPVPVKVPVPVPAGAGGPPPGGLPPGAAPGMAPRPPMAGMGAPPPGVMPPGGPGMMPHKRGGSVKRASGGRAGDDDMNSRLDMNKQQLRLNQAAMDRDRGKKPRYDLGSDPEGSPAPAPWEKDQSPYRKRGGSVKMTAGAESGMGRLQKSRMVD